MYNNTSYRFLKATANLMPRGLRREAGYVYFRMMALFYTGNAVECPVCGGTFRHFLTHRGRANALCPQCLSLERHRLQWLYLQEKTDFFSADLRVLHFAPELHFIRRIRQLPNLDYISADLNPVVADERVDITAIQYPDNSFDAILCNHVLEHIPDDRLAMRELCRVLKPGGWAILQVPIDESRATTLEDPTITTPEQRQQFYGHHDHQRMYGRDYMERLESAGFTVTRDDFVRHLPPERIERSGLSTGELIYFCEKPHG